ncbi:GTP 3',8-cyclase MoaA [Patulibacter medicamentivorans]|uniref:GTP 3',8-cyclase MoaA n=1 Tax=Patulibacter medicamentivorans TaxID=1097667 RepID=UPI000680BE0A
MDGGSPRSVEVGATVATAAPLSDGFGRIARDLRLSVTDVCNLRCRYCLPDEQMAWLPREQRLAEDETVRLVTLLARLGVRTVRVTGGEPLVRPRLAPLVARIAAIEGIEELSLTTNGVLLAKHAEALAQAGISRVNVSLDSVDPQRFNELTRRDLLPRVLEGIAAAQAQPGIEQVKLNAVAMRGITEHEALDLVAFARAQDLQLRFIEVMPLDAGHRWRQQDVLSAEELRAIIATRWAVEPLEREPASTATVFRFADGGGEVGFIASVTEPFCADCDRIRLTADGQLRTCLFAHDETDLRGPLRSGADDRELERIVRGAVAGKQWGHEIHRPGFRPPDRPMSAIGG